MSILARSRASSSTRSMGKSERLTMAPGPGRRLSLRRQTQKCSSTERTRSVFSDGAAASACASTRQRSRGPTEVHCRAAPRCGSYPKVLASLAFTETASKLRLARGRRLWVCIVFWVEFLSKSGTERASGTVHRMGRSCHLGKYKAWVRAPKALVSGEDAQHAMQILSLPGVLGVLRAGCRWAIEFNGWRRAQ